MSVQVRRRREAAAFLSSFVGAQGELLVETTNNRVQVHDGATPGGVPAAAIRDLQGFNLGINTSGSINQRGVSGTVTLAAGQYGHDRMKGGAAGCTYTFATAADGDTTFTITSGSLVQAIDASNIFASALWLSWTGTAQARVYQGAASAAPAYGAGLAVPIDGTTVAAILISGLALGTITAVEFNTGTLNTARPWQLEAALPNAGPTRLARRHAATELQLCQRYYAFLPLSVGFWDAASNTRFWQVSCLAVPMRATPTLTLVSAGSGITDPFTASYTITALNYTELSPTSIAIGLTTSGGTAGRSGYPHVDVKISASAEI